MLTFDNELVSPVDKINILLRIYTYGLRRQQQCDATVIMEKTKIQMKSIDFYIILFNNVISKISKITKFDN